MRVDTHGALLRSIPEGRRLGSRHRRRPGSDRISEAGRAEGRVVQITVDALGEHLHRSHQLTPPPPGQIRDRCGGRLPGQTPPGHEEPVAEDAGGGLQPRRA